MIIEIVNPYPDQACFFCGRDNQQGLHLRFFYNDEIHAVFADYLPESRFAGQGTILHGGIQAGIMDEIMGWTGFFHTKTLAVTTTLDMRYHRPVYITDKPVRISCRYLKTDGNKIHLEAEITDGAGTVCTSAAGVFHVIPEEKYNALVRR